MAHFKLKIVGDLAELAGIAAALAGTPTEHAVAAPRVVGSPPELAAPYGPTTTMHDAASVYDVGAAATATMTVEELIEQTAKPAPAKRTRKASTVDTPATGAETFAEQIKEVVASEAAEVPTAAAADTANAAATTDASSSASATTADRPADLKEACQALVKKLMGDSRYQTADILKALEAHGGKGVTAIAENSPANLPALFDKLTGMAA